MVELYSVFNLSVFIFYINCDKRRPIKWLHECCLVILIRYSKFDELIKDVKEMLHIQRLDRVKNKVVCVYRNSSASGYATWRDLHLPRLVSEHPRPLWPTKHKEREQCETFIAIRNLILKPSYIKPSRPADTKLLLMNARKRTNIFIFYTLKLI